MKLAAVLTLAAILVFWLRRRDFIEPLPNVFEDDVDWLRDWRRLDDWDPRVSGYRPGQ